MNPHNTNECFKMTLLNGKLEVLKKKHKFKRNYFTYNRNNINVYINKINIKGQSYFIWKTNINLKGK